MNHSTEIAQEKTGKITAKELLAVWKKGQRHYMHGSAVYDRPSYSDSFIFEVSSVSGGHCSFDKSPETVTKVNVPGFVSNGSTSLRKTHTPTDGSKPWTTYGYEAYRPTKGYWYLSYSETLPNILALLPGKAEVSFQVCLDAHTNGYLANADFKEGSFVECGLHGDALYLFATWTERGKVVEKRFEVGSSIGAHNSARFGNPRHDRDTEGSGY